jgi:hypothetical protein
MRLAELETGELPLAVDFSKPQDLRRSGALRLAPKRDARNVHDSAMPVYLDNPNVALAVYRQLKQRTDVLPFRAAALVSPSVRHEQLAEPAGIRPWINSTGEGLCHLAHLIGIRFG